ncbi:hypothetical protein BGW41_004473 [Actinomortierella wolfii]|nr:hypothetical protein BGW41_004473 [Actinomortierella wolfii]
MNPFSVLEYAQANISIPSSLLRRKFSATKEQQQQQEQQQEQQKNARQPQLAPNARRSSPLAPHSQPPSQNLPSSPPGRPPHTTMQRTHSSTSIDRGHHSFGNSPAIATNTVPMRVLRRQSTSASVHTVLRDDIGTGSLPRQSSSARASMDGRYLRPSLKDITTALSSSSTAPNSPADALKPRSFSASAASSEARWNTRFHRKTPSSASASSSTWLSTPPMTAVVAAVTGVVTGASNASSSSDVPSVVDDDLVLPPPVAVKRAHSGSSTSSAASASPLMPPRHHRTSSSSSVSSRMGKSTSSSWSDASSSGAAGPSIKGPSVPASTSAPLVPSTAAAAKATEPVTVVPPTPPASPPVAVETKSSPSFLGRIPRPSPLGPLRAAQRVVSSVTQAGSGLLPSKDQLESLPVAGRILKHPVMDSTLNYIASKTPGLNQRDQRRLFDPHHDGSPLTAADEHYRKLNRRLVEHAMTLSALAIEKEALSKTGEDEAGDDAFELYLAAIATLVHALPIETCDPLRREAYENQLRSVLAESEQYSQNVGRLLDDRELAKHRRRRRRRHRYQREQASYLIQHTLLANERAAAAAAAAQAAEAQRLTTRLSNIINPRRYFGGGAPPNSAQPATSSSVPSQPTQPGPSPLSKSSSSSSLASMSKAPGSQRPRGTHHSRHHVSPSASSRMSKRRRRQMQREARRGLSDKIVSTAVDSAIRLKQSRIPEAVGAAYRASRFILGKVDERFHLQEKAWNLSRQGVEKAIELDQQYAIHEMVAETLFATVTGLVKAGIAYKETPGYADLRQQQMLEQQQQQQVEGASKMSSENETPSPPYLASSVSQQSATRGFLSTIAAAASEVNSGVKRRVNNPQTIVSAEQMVLSNNDDEGDESEDHEDDTGFGRYEDEDTSDESDSDSDGYGSEDTDSSQSSYLDDEDNDEKGSAIHASELAGRDLQGNKDDDVDEEEDLTSSRADDAKEGGLGAPYAEQVRQKIDLFMAFKGAASLFVGNL